MAIGHLFFDLDHTIWDYDRNSVEALNRLYAEFALEELGLAPKERFLAAFKQANLVVWDLFDENRVNSNSLRHKRLELVFESFNLPARQIEGFHEGYYRYCGSGMHLIEGASDLLDKLSARYTLHIITNGFNDSQHHKLRNTGLDGYFKTVTTSESAQSKKPDAAFFDFALTRAGASKHNSLVIGDGLRTDVAGALNYGLPVIWFNPEGKETELKPNAEVRYLVEIGRVLGI